MSKLYEGFSTHITGITGNGKSYWTKKKLIPLLVKFKPVIIFDYKGEYAGPRAIDHNPSWNSYKDFDDFLFKSVKRKKITKQVHVIYSRNNEDYIKGLQFLEWKRAQVSIILDEAQFIFKDNNLSDARTPLVKLVRAGRSDGTDVIMISQRVMDMPPDIRSQFTKRITFFQQHSADIYVMYNDNGFLNAEQARELDKTEYMILGSFPDHLKLKSNTK